MANFSLDCAEILGLTQTCEFWGDIINYRNVQSYTARARVSGDRNKESIIPAWSGMSELINYTTGVMPIYVQGVLLGTGKLTSMNFEGNVDVDKKFYNIGFEILKSGDLSFVTGELYNGITGAFSFLSYLNSFSEQAEYSQSNNRTTDYTRSIDFNLERGHFNSTTGAQIISRSILGTLTELGVYYPLPPPQYSGIEGMVRNINQSLDNINGRYSYSESYSYQSGVPWVHEYQHSLNYGENGVATVTENGSIQSNKRKDGVGERIQFAESGWASIKSGIYFRVSDVFFRWSDKFQSRSGCAILNYPIQENVTKDYARGIVSYNYQYSNDKAVISGATHSYEQSISLNDAGWLEVGVNGSLRTRQINPSGALDSLYLKYNTEIRPAITGYAQNIYQDTKDFFKSVICSTGYNGSISLVNSEETFGELPAEISYNYSFTDDPTYFSTGLFRKIKNTVSNQEITALVNTFKLVNYLELPQNSFQSNLGVLTNNIEIVGSSGVTIQQYRNAASGKLVLPTGEYWMTNNSYSFNPFTYQFSASIGYTYEGYRAINNFTI